MAPMPLEGIRILDLTIWQAGPAGVGILADLGADVIKIEDPVNGDPGRGLRIGPEGPGAGLNPLVEGTSRNKRAMTLDLKSDKGREVFYRMVKTADVVTENYRTGVAERLGVDHPTLARYNPKIILASASGLGRKGPDAEVGLLDIMGHARSGLMQLISDPEQPLRYIGGYGIADTSGAVMFAVGILAALTARSLHNVGQHMEVSQLGALMTLQTLPIQQFLLTGGINRIANRKRTGNPLFSIYRAKDGKWLCLACAQRERYWHDFCEVLGLGDVEKDPRFAPQPLPEGPAEELIKTLDKVFATKARDEWVRSLNARGVSCSPVNDYPDLVQDPQVLANEYLIEVDHPVAGRIREVGFPMKFSETPARFRSVAPEFGQHTEEVLLEFGFEWEEIEKLRDAGVI